MEIIVTIIGTVLVLSIFLQSPTQETLGNSFANQYRSKGEIFLSRFTYTLVFLLFVVVYFMR